VLASLGPAAGKLEIDRLLMLLYPLDEIVLQEDALLADLM
jgi:hypothetical protein